MPKKFRTSTDAIEKKESLNLLLVNPSLDWMTEKEQMIAIRLEKSIPNQESPPLNVAYLLASVKRAGFTVKFIDMIVDRYSVEKLVQFCAETRPALIGFSAFTRQIGAVGRIAKAIKADWTEATICVGGCHVFAMPLETLEEIPEIDFVFCGEADELLPKILEEPSDLKAISKLPGVIARGKQDLSPTFVKDLDALPFPSWEEFDLTKYPGNGPHGTKLQLPMITGRGCPYRCTFCCRANGDFNRRRSVQNVIAEMEYLVDKFGCEAIYFYDENFILDNKWTDQLFDDMIERGLNRKVKWGCSMRVQPAKPKLMQRMAEAGCYYVFFGFESANENTLKRIKKGITTQQMREAVLATKQAGIIPVGAFIIGLPGEREEEIYQAIDLGKELYLYSITFPIAVPYPGTEMREQAMKHMWGMKILHDNWEEYGKKERDASENFQVMESDDFSAYQRLEMQKIAYKAHPKKKIQEYIELHLTQFKGKREAFPNEERLMMKF